MKKLLITLLVCLNLGLLAAIVTTSSPQAGAQGYPPTDYVVVTGAIDERYDALYIIDAAKRRLVGWRFDWKSKRLLIMDTRNLRTDFPSPNDD